MRFNRLVVALALAASLAALAALAACSNAPAYDEASFAGEEVRIGVGSLQDYETLFRSYTVKGKKINFFVIKTTDGIRTYFDACAKCFPKKLGYRSDGQYMVCRACGTRFHKDRLEGLGSCHPIALEGRVAGDELIIDREEIIKGFRYF